MTEDKYLGNKSLIWHPGTGEMTAAQLAAIHTRHASAIRPIPSTTALGYDHLMADADRGALLAELNRSMEEAYRLRDELERVRTVLVNAHEAGMSLGQDVERLQVTVERARKALFEDAALSDNHRLVRLTSILGTDME